MTTSKNPRVDRSRPRANRTPAGQVRTTPPTWEPPLSYLGNAEDIGPLTDNWFRAELCDGTVHLLPSCPEAIPTAIGSRPLAAQLADECERIAELYRYTAAFLRQLKENELGIAAAESEGN